MAANQAIINAAGQAYSPVKGQYDLSGFVNGIAAVANGVVQRKKAVEARTIKAGKIVIESNINAVQQKTKNIQSALINFEISPEQAQAEVVKIKDELKIVDEIKKEFTKINETGIALNGGLIDENYFLAIKDGSLTDGSNVRINTKFGSYNESTFFKYEDGKLLVLGPNGNMITPTELLAKAKNIPTTALTKDYDNAVSSWQKKPFESGKTSKWASSRDAFTGDIAKLFRNKQVMYTSLVDNNKGFNITNDKNETKNFNWHDYYMEKGLTEDQQFEYNEILNGYDEDVREKVKGQVLVQVMEADKNLMDDVDGFINSMVNHKKPTQQSVIAVVSKPTAKSSFKVEGDLNTKDRKQLYKIASLEQSIEDVKSSKSVEIGKVAARVLGGKLELVRSSDEDNKERYYFRDNALGNTDASGAPLPDKFRSGRFFLRDISDSGFMELMLALIQTQGIDAGDDIYVSYKNHLKK